MVQGKTAHFAAKFWLGFNSFVLLFLAVNISTIGVELASHWPFLLALGYMIFMSIYLSRWAYWKVIVLLAIGLVAAAAFGLMLIAGKVSSGMQPLAVTHVALSVILFVGGLAQLRVERHVADRIQHPSSR